MINTIQSIKEKIDFYGLWEDPRILSLFRVLFINPEDESVATQLHKIIKTHPKALKKQLSSNPFPCPDAHSYEENDILLGVDENEIPYYINAKSFVKILLVMGAIGFGKTYVMLNIILQLLSQKIRVLVFDFKKDLRGIAANSQLVFLQFCEKPNFQWNPLQKIKGITRKEQWHIFANCLSETTYLRQGSSAILHEALNELSNNDAEITIQELYSHIRSKKYTTPRENEWKASILRGLRTLLLNAEPIISCKKGIDIIDLIENNDTILELDQAGDLKSFFPTLISSYLLKSKINRNIRSANAPLHITVCDEGNFLFSKMIQRHSIAGIPSIIAHIQTGREFGSGWLITTNEPQEMSDTIKNNAANKIMLYLGDWPNIYNANKAMAHNDIQTQFTQRLGIGEGIVKKEGGQSHKITLKEPDIKPTIISDDEIRSMSKSVIDKYPVITEVKESMLQKPKEPTLSNDEMTLLKDIHANITLSKTEHYKSAGFSADKGNRLSKKLIEEDFIKESDINMGGAVRQAKILFLTDNGYSAIKATPSCHKTRGDGDEHLFWTTLYHKQLLESGIHSEISHRLNSKEADLGIINPDKSITAIEISITTTAEHEADQALRDIAAGFKIVHIIADKKKAEKITSLLPRSQENISVHTFEPNINTILNKKKGEKTK
ncbi:MAG: hypothetical protein EOM23_00340 [Candidatus Moranbacteria bacterium]|nr:hypothetical protein [Candidatus Moranbacteria bacterium]